MTNEEHKHLEFEVTTEYRRNELPRVVSAKCTECGEENIDVLDIFQEREIKQFALESNDKPG